MAEITEQYTLISDEIPYTSHYKRVKGATSGCLWGKSLQSLSHRAEFSLHVFNNKEYDKLDNLLDIVAISHLMDCFPWMILRVYNSLQAKVAKIC